MSFPLRNEGRANIKNATFSKGKARHKVQRIYNVKEIRGLYCIQYAYFLERTMLYEERYHK